MVSNAGRLDGREDVETLSNENAGRCCAGVVRLMRLEPGVNLCLAGLPESSCQ